MEKLNELKLPPLAGGIVWLSFAVLFFYSGLYLTQWLLEPTRFEGGWRWILLGMFPVLLRGFFWVNRRFGCASGGCRSGRCATTSSRDGSGPMPGA